MHICVLGLGYIGLPTAAVLARHNHRVTGVDVRPEVIDTLRQGRIHIEEPGLAQVVAEAVDSGALEVSLEPVAADVFIVAVPTPIREDKSADLSFVCSAARALVPVLRPGNLVILESTSPPGTTVDLFAPILSESGLIPCRDLLVAHSPERVLPGRILEELVGNDRVVGGMDPASAEAARAVYQTFVRGRIFMTDATTAEMVKVMENTYRDVNIALANELALMCGNLGIDAHQVIELANRHPRVHLHRPGPGVGGHCISVDPWFLVEKCPAEARLIRTARMVNDGMPRGVVRWARERLEDVPRPRVALLGLAYKADVDDCRESPAVEVLHLLEAVGFEVAACDPHVAGQAHVVVSPQEAFRDADLAILLTDHREFRDLDPAELVALMRRPCVLDTRRFLDATAWQVAGAEWHDLGKLALPGALGEEPAPPLAKEAIAGVVAG